MPRRTVRLGLDTGLFFLLFYLYVWLVIDSRLIYQSLGIRTFFPDFSFSSGWAFLGEHLGRPGGLVEYVARFLTQLFCFGWAGSLMVTATALAACLATDVLARLAGGTRGMVARFVPAMVLLMFYGGYHHPLRTILSVLVGLACFALYLRWVGRGPAKRSAVFLVACVALYCLADTAGLLFATLVAIHEFLIRRRPLAGMAALLLGLAMPGVVGKMLFGLAVKGAYGGFLFLDPGVLASGRVYTVVLYVFFPAILVGFVLQRVVLAGRASRARDRSAPEADASNRAASGSFRQERRKRLLQTVAVFLAAGAVGRFWLDAPVRAALLIDYYCERGKWLEVLDAADNVPPGTYFARYNRDIMLALHHTGRLGDEMFRYPQISGEEWFETLGRGGQHPYHYVQDSRFFLELGHVNRAERCLHEALEGMGESPTILRHLALINIVKDRPETASMFLRALAKNPLHCRGARELLERLEKDPYQQSDARVRELRRAMVTKDDLSYGVDAEAFLQELLQQNPHNRIAFDFLMAYYLYSAQSEKVVANLGLLENFGYGEIPRHYQEAIVIRSNATGQRVSDSPYTLSPEVIRRADEFAWIQAHAADRKEVADLRVEAGLSDSYYFYFTYGASGL